jgi:pimeloyl-ACP methyl ester carboxylesterase
MWGKEDQVCDYSCLQSWKDLVPGARVVELPLAGHALPIEDIDIVFASVLETIENSTKR